MVVSYGGTVDLSFQFSKPTTFFLIGLHIVLSNVIKNNKIGNFYA